MYDHELCSAAADNDPAPCVLRDGHDGKHRDADGYTWRTHGHKYGRPDVYEITWMSGHIETVLAHQVTYPHRGLAMLGMGSLGFREETGPPRVQIHAEVNGHWRLTLSAREEDIRTMRLVTEAERIPEAGA